MVAIAKPKAKPPKNEYKSPCCCRVENSDEILNQIKKMMKRISLIIFLTNQFQKLFSFFGYFYRVVAND